MSENTKTGGWRENKWIRGAIPALLLHCSIGTVYCWSLFSQEIGEHIGFSKSATEWAFSFAIFFLGMSAAIVKAVEKSHPEALTQVMYHGEMQTVNPLGYQTVLYVTLVLYIVSLLISLFMVRKIEEK